MSTTLLEASDARARERRALELARRRRGAGEPRSARARGAGTAPLAARARGAGVRRAPRTRRCWRASCSSCSTRSPGSWRSTARSATAGTRGWSPSGSARRARSWRSTATRSPRSASRALAAERACSMRFIRSGYAEALELLAGEGVRADIVYFDLGMSSMQVDTRERGFSYSYEAPLDMRMDPAQELSARQIVAEWDERRLAHVLRDFGEERHAGAIARAIVRRRERAPIETTQELVETISSAMPAPARFAGGHPAKRSFQALRIAVNDELGQLDRALPLAWELLREGGVLAGIAFHSLEDRRVKRFLAERARGCICPPDLPVCACGREPEAALLDAPLDRAVGAEEVDAQPARRLGAPARRPQARQTARRPSDEPPAAAAAERPAPRDGAAHARGAARRPRRGRGGYPGPARPPARARPALRQRARHVRAALAWRVGAWCGRAASRATGALDRLIRGRSWIALIAFALIGIVTLQLRAAAEREHRPCARARGAAAARERRAQHRRLGTGLRRTRRGAGGAAGHGARARSAPCASSRPTRAADVARAAAALNAPRAQRRAQRRPSAQPRARARRRSRRQNAGERKREHRPRRNPAPARRRAKAPRRRAPKLATAGSAGSAPAQRPRATPAAPTRAQRRRRPRARRAANRATSPPAGRAPRAAWAPASARTG